MAFGPRSLGCGMSASLQKRGERRNECASDVAESALQVRDDVCAVAWIPRPERYVVADSQLHVHFGVRRGVLN